MNPLRSLFRSRDKPKDSLNGSRYSFFFGGTSSGKPVNETTAMQMTAVYSCVRILSETVAGLPLNVYRYNDSGGKEKALKHSLYRLLHDESNPEMTSFAFRETLMSHLLLWGNAYAQIIRNARGEVIALYPLMPNKMTVDRDQNGKLFYSYQRSAEDPIALGKSSQVTLSPSDVLHIPGIGFDGLIGYSPIAMAKNAIGLAIATEEYGAKFFANGAAPSGVLEHPGTIKDPLRVKESWNSAYQGNANVAGTYAQSGTTVSVTLSGHGYKAGHMIYADITSGSGVDGAYKITAVDEDTFQYTAGTSLTTSGNITLRRCAIRRGGGVHSVSDLNIGCYAINFANELLDENYVFSANVSEPSATTANASVAAADPSDITNMFIGLTCEDLDGGYIDCPVVSVSIFG